MGSAEAAAPATQGLAGAAAPASGHCGMAGCLLVEQGATGHDLTAVPDRGGILVSCTCGWQAWTPTGAAPASLLAAQHQLGGEHLADVGAPVPPRSGSLWAVGIFGALVCATALAVYLIWRW